MPNAIVICQDNRLRQECSLLDAHRLLGQGHATIAKFYPFTVQLKPVLPFKDDETDPCGMPVQPNSNPPTLTQRRKLITIAEV